MAKENKKNIKKYKNIILYGFMCSGKTAIAKEFAKKFNLKFIDTDLIFKKKYGRISEFVKKKGFKKFREIEKKIFKKAISQKDSIISAGGGIFPGSSKNCLEIFLNPSFKTLEKRFNNNKKTRPLLFRYPENRIELKELYLKRFKKYKKAKYHIKETNKNKIINLIKFYYENNKIKNRERN
jgi:shikimate kinase